MKDLFGKFVQVGDFCPNKACADYGKPQGEHQHSIIRFGKTKAGRQRFKCNTCGGTFTETKGTVFYRRHTPEDEIIETLAFVAEAWCPSTVGLIRSTVENPHIWAHRTTCA